MGLLADWFVKLSVKGGKEALAELEGLKKSLKETGTEGQIDKVNKKIVEQQKAMEAAKQGANAWANGLRNAFLLGTAGMVGMVKMGLAGTVEGERMALAFQKFSQQIAAIFLPVVEAISGAMERLTGWMRGLSGDTQDAIMTWVSWAAGLGFAVLMIGKVVGAVQLLSAAFVGLQISSGGILVLLGLIATVITGIVMAVKGLNSETAASAAEAKKHREVMKAGQGFEGIKETYKRMQLAAIKDPARGIAARETVSEKSALLARKATLEKTTADVSQMLRTGRTAPAREAGNIWNVGQNIAAAIHNIGVLKSGKLSPEMRAAYEEDLKKLVALTEETNRKLAELSNKTSPAIGK